MPRIRLLLIWISVAATVVAFFLPWVRLEVRQPGLLAKVRETAEKSGLLGALTEKLGDITATVSRGAESVTGMLPSLSDIPRTISGVQVPQLVNQKNAKLALMLFEMVTNKRQDIGRKSYAVYLVPGIALVCGLLLTGCGRVKAVPVVVGLLCAGIAGVGFWKLLTLNTDIPFLAITIGPGLWVSLWAYAVLAAAALLVRVPGRSPT